MRQLARRAAMLAAALLAAAALASAPADASTTTSAPPPRPHCAIGTYWPPCSCPKGWHLHRHGWGPFAGTFFCSRQGASVWVRIAGNA
jgi:hypothetical protein